MGWGDELLATGEARWAQEQDGGMRRVAIHDRKGRVRWHPLWEGNPRILNPRDAVQDRNHIRIDHAAHCRPYVDYTRMRRDFETLFPGQPFNTRVKDKRLPWRFTDRKCRRGEIHCIGRRKPGGYLVIEPHFKPRQVNRDWGWSNWQALVDAVAADWVQINHPGARLLAGVRHEPAASFIAACEVLSGAAGYVGPEGGLYHAAAALGVPAVAIFGGYVSPANQGYDDAVNLYEAMDGASPCGQRVPCGHCRDAMSRIEPDVVAGHVRRLVR